MKLVCGPRRIWVGHQEHKPFDDWPIFLADPTTQTVDVAEPPTDAMEGTIERQAFHVWMDLQERRIVIQPRADVTRDDVIYAEREIMLARDAGRLISRNLTPEMISELEGPIDIVDNFGPKLQVVRCVEVGCDSFMGWHRAESDLEGKSKIAEWHTAHDVSNEYFRCRLVLQKGMWVPDIGVKVAMRANPVRGSRLLADAAGGIAQAASELNALTAETA